MTEKITERRWLNAPELVLIVGLVLFETVALPLHRILSDHWSGGVGAPSPPLGWWIFTTVYFGIFVWILLLFLGWRVRNLLAPVVALAFGCISAGAMVRGGPSIHAGFLTPYSEPATFLIFAGCAFLLIVLSVQHRKIRS